MTQPHPSFPHPQHHLGFLNPFLMSQTAPQDFLLPSHPSGTEENVLPGDLLHFSLPSPGMQASHSSKSSCLNRKGIMLARTSMEASLGVFSRGRACVLTTSLREETKELRPLNSGSPKPCHLQSVLPSSPKRTGGRGGGGGQGGSQRCMETI